MPRMSEAEKQRSHSRIVDAAARLFRKRGIEATSVADVMKAAGMTHGGFYRHFASKADLVAAAFQHAVDDVVAKVEQADSPAGRAQVGCGHRSSPVSLMERHVFPARALLSAPSPWTWRVLRGPREGYFDVDPSKRLTMGVAYFTLLILLALGMMAAERPLEDLQPEFDWSGEPALVSAPERVA